MVPRIGFEPMFSTLERRVCLTATLTEVNIHMKIHEIVVESFHWKNKNKIYSLLINSINSGPFDGGCVVFANALHLVYGGKVVVLVSDKNIAEHAALLINNVLYDADGPAKYTEFVKRFERNELVGTGRYIIEIRDITDSDLPDAPRDMKLSKQIANLIREK